MTDTATVLLVDDHQAVSEGIRGMLSRHESFSVIATAQNGREAIERCRALSPDMILMDINMPEIDGIEATIQLKRICPSARVIVYTMHSDTAYMKAIFKAGASGVVLKSDPLEELNLALYAVQGGGVYISTGASGFLQKEIPEPAHPNETPPPFSRLSFREKEVLRLLAEGLSVKETAYQLDISPSTVESHKYKIMSKLDARRMADLYRIAVKNGLVSL